MLKSLHKRDTQTSPFVVTKDWNLSNTFNDWVVLTEHSGGLSVALEYEEYLTTTASVNSSCNIALEQQGSDRVLFRKGQKATGVFYPDDENVNIDGTYKRMVYSQVQNMFYNSFRDPTKIWGLEYLDFENSQTKRFLSDEFNLYNVPTSIFGEKIVPNTVIIRNQTLDNDYSIVDDGKGNLFAVSNLFSRVQELGDFTNDFVSGISSYCDAYFGWPNTDIIVEASITDTISDINTTLRFGNLSSADPFTDTLTDIHTGILTGSIIQTILTTSGSDSGSSALSFYTGSLITVILTTSSFDSGSSALSFYTGSLITVILTTSSFDSGSSALSFYNGSIVTVVEIADELSEPTSINVGLLSGSLG
jgi:hypothetical protein